MINGYSIFTIFQMVYIKLVFEMVSYIFSFPIREKADSNRYNSQIGVVKIHFIFIFRRFFNISQWNQYSQTSDCIIN
jgi:hypothetical protein